MILLWVFGGLLTALSVLLLVQPLLRRHPPAQPREAHDATIVADQLVEIDRDQADGLIDGEAAAAARRELKRRLLTALERVRPATDAADAPPPHSRYGRLLGLLLALTVPALAIAVYVLLGKPMAPDEPLVMRRTTGDLAEANQQPEVDQSLLATVTDLERYLASHGNDGQGWLMLGRAYLTLDRSSDAVAALAKAKELLPGRPDVTAAYGEALVLAGEGQVGEAARDQFTEALAADPRNVQARYYLALGRAQAGDVAGALQDWVDLVALSPRGAPWVPLVRQQIAAAVQAVGADPATLKPSAAALALAPPSTAAPALGGEATASPGPNAEDVQAAAAMSPEQRQAMIRSMVERLATRLQQNPDDRQGWLRLASAYDVLGETAKAADARARAAAATQ